MSDQYRESAEYIDVMSRVAWQELGPLLAGALTTAKPVSGPVVDLGAGTGLGTLVIAKALPEAEIIAVEPSSGLRAVLLSKVYDDPDLARRVTSSLLAARSSCLTPGSPRSPSANAPTKDGDEPNHTVRTR
jgi:predicted O-methyltransferase YrrM